MLELSWLGGLVLLLALHHVGDVWGQPTWLIQMKKKHAFAVFEHVMVYSLVQSAGLYLLGLFSLWHFFYFLIGHFIVDLVKYRFIPWKDAYWPIYPDQALHYLQIILLYAIVA